jgi:hypothetical protein
MSWVRRHRIEARNPKDFGVEAPEGNPAARLAVSDPAVFANLNLQASVDVREVEERGSVRQADAVGEQRIHLHQTSS